ncbi:MAG: TPR end-of-group domain-containing protein, partial [Promethearchaeota archaeon]
KNPDAYLPDVTMTQNNLGILYADLGRFAEAETAYKAALDTYKKLAEMNPEAYLPRVAMTQNNLGILYVNLGRFEEAEIAIQEALEIDPRDSNTWYNKACIESISDFKEKSIESLKRAIELDKKWVELAKSDEDFDNVRTSKEFKEIIREKN